MKQVKISVSRIPQSEKSKSILIETKTKMGFIPNMYHGMAGNTSLIDGYTSVYNSFRENSGFSPVEQEVILLSVSYVNYCEYCMAAHSFIGDKMTKVPTEITNALREGATLPEAKLNALSHLTKIMTENRGRVSQEQVEEFFNAGYDESHLLGIITGISVKTMSNYSNHITQPDLDAIFTGRIWKNSVIVKPLKYVAMKRDKIIRVFLSIMFLMTGVMKLMLPHFGNTFLIQLSEANIPFPYLNYWIVPIIELGIGLMLFFNYKTVIALLFIIPLMLVALYVHIVVSNPAAFPAQPQFPIIPIIVLIMVTYLLNKAIKE